MTYSNLKQRIYDLLDLRVETGVSNGSIVEAVGSAIDGAVSSASRKIAAMLKNIVRRKSVTFTQVGSVSSSAAPSDIIGISFVISGGKRYDGCDFSIIDGNIVSSSGVSGSAELIYTAYASQPQSDSSELEFDGLCCDILAYGAALELCSVAYPGDYDRYSVIATEYDERMANALLCGGNTDKVKNTLYAKRRLV